MPGPTGPLGESTDRRATTDMALVPDIRTWLNDAVKTMKGFRVYADNNEMLVKFIEQAYTGLDFLLRRDPELTLSVREDRLLYGKEPVHVNADREEGLPFLLYRNAFRRIVLVRGMTREELIEFMRAISTDYTSFDLVGEDLVTTLWRLQLPHVRYLTIDALSVTKSQDMDPEEADKIERIQGDIENIVAAIYRTGAADDDLVAGVSISREDLEALRAIRAEDPEDLELLDHATERAITDIPESQLARVQSDLRDENQDSLSRKILDILIQILFRETSSEHSAATIELIQQLFDAMVLARRYGDAIELIKRLRTHANTAESMQQMHVSRHLLSLFATESRVMPALSTLNEQQQVVSTTELLEFLRALGPSIPPILVRALDTLTSPAHRRAICDLVIELGVPSLAALSASAETAKWFVVRDILGLAQQYNKAEIGPLVAMGLRHEHPKVRLVAVGMLRGYGRGTADELLSERFEDDDLEVRLAAYRVAAARRSREVQPALEVLLQEDGLAQRDPRELRLLMAAYAAIARYGAIPLLGNILNAGFLASFTHTEAQVGAAFALASLGPDAVPVLQRGSRTLNPRVRDACRRALGRDNKRSRSSSRIGAPGAGPKSSTSNRPQTGEVPIDPGPRTGASDPLADAPPLRLDIPLPDVDPTQTMEMEVERPRPALPRYDGPGLHTDELPSNLPPAPSRDLPGASPGEIPLGGSVESEVRSGRLNILGEHSVDLVTGPLPPPPGAIGGTLEDFEEPPPVVSSDTNDYLDAHPSRVDAHSPPLMVPAGIPADAPARGEVRTGSVPLMPDNYGAEDPTQPRLSWASHEGASPFAPGGPDWQSQSGLQPFEGEHSSVSPEPVAAEPGRPSASAVPPLPETFPPANPPLPPFDAYTPEHEAPMPRRLEPPNQPPPEPNPVPPIGGWSSDPAPLPSSAFEPVPDSLPDPEPIPAPAYEPTPPSLGVPPPPNLSWDIKPSEAWTKPVRQEPSDSSAQSRSASGSFGEPDRSASGSFGVPDHSAAGSFGERSASGSFGESDRSASGSFGVPDHSAGSFGERSASGSFGVPDRSASGSFGVPDRPPSGSFGVPDRPPSGSFGVPDRSPAGVPAHSAGGSFGVPDRSASGSFGVPDRPPSGSLRCS